MDTFGKREIGEKLIDSGPYTPGTVSNKQRKFSFCSQKISLFQRKKLTSNLIRKTKRENLQNKKKEEKKEEGTRSEKNKEKWKERGKVKKRKEKKNREELLF